MFGLKWECKYYSLYKLYSKMKDVLTALQDCYKELNDGSMNIGLCLEEVLDEKNLQQCSDPKYVTCRKVYACAAKKLGLLDKKGKIIPCAWRKYRDRVDDQKEFDKVFDACKSVEGTGSQAVINTLQCILRTSSKARKKMDEAIPYLKKL